ncbi:hypothetical protein LEP1GSC133_0719 [Leptospira borgpetersenii serovar Pomona str. 200901868]|uniref:Uncharacterized protein n=1 Tax=Leptospira borgpetersenii serovar Pomona str. 200901868 TaxID=1192866 RepID=M6WHG2_LEPBO|nr:hypothetical protein LEP1GSC133_0719 [Leptospira borgpetersenii serovar Pomona str. 200901868]
MTPVKRTSLKSGGVPTISKIYTFFRTLLQRPTSKKIILSNVSSVK